MKISLTNRVRTTIRERKLFREGDRLVLVALSGGADSVALLCVLRELGYETVAAHCNFHLRGVESDEDAAFVEGLCRDLDVPLHRIDFDTVRYARERSISIEMAARELRYEWFGQLRKELAIEYVAVAHHADDNAETMVLNLCRGTGISGLCGMPYKRNDGIVRPLLDATRDEIEAYLLDQKITYRTDSSNEDTRFRRNLVRHRIMPLLKELNPSLQEALLRTRENLEGVAAFYSKATEDFHNTLRATSSISIREVKETPAPFTLLYDLLHPYGFNRDQIREVATSLDNPPGASFFSSSHRLLRERDRLTVLPLSPKMEVPELFGLKIGDSFLDLPDGKQLSWQRGTPADLDLEGLRLPNTKLLLPLAFVESLQEELGVRRPQRGDHIHPYGMKGCKTVSRFFIDRHVPRSRREEAWLLCQGTEVVWIMGYAADRRFAIDELSDTEEYLLFSFEL
ncbi:tRNA lysidine(34) synthetase TilS [Porphyromonas gingivalis]|uniref:tRNA lysidine(34) synthetase TilS n=1 Tax=Porphyromonas gingivalis TaxID=837 RepID=UPI000C185C09|nr:tRNA lysidine(34) synthetase TilS [Porphyromonas gingivalis]ATR94456.1 tRNA lysidine(34) synthetase TilS [Porphyromonas gingivalis]ATR97449.1 tRNA lysidine(34) synthetase TilS [Porphyromonas gingivalis]MCE8164806.1 tRNA lysidine(34) synthetase TilS [Porphyromonas gingivalis]